MGPQTLPSSTANPSMRMRELERQRRLRAAGANTLQQAKRGTETRQQIAMGYEMLFSSAE